MTISHGFGSNQTYEFLVQRDCDIVDKNNPDEQETLRHLKVGIEPNLMQNKFCKSLKCPISLAKRPSKDRM